jgi:hypothetical protein
MIDSEQWLMIGVKDKGDIYECLLEKNAEDTSWPKKLLRTSRQVLLVFNKY